MVKQTLQEQSTQAYPDLPPCITEDQQVLFIGYNPGLQSSIQQHHYAHFSNSFWKLFNQSKLFLKVLERIPTDPQDPFLERVTDYNETWLRPEHDASLINYKVGFTDLVLRCTKTAQELTSEEKLENVPRLLHEFNYTKSRFLVFIGKGIWEVMIKYLARSMGVAPPKLDSATFEWGRQCPDKIIRTTSDRSSKSRQTVVQLLEHFYTLVPKGVAVYVFPSTSGLVTTMNFAQKLEHWSDLAAQV